MWLAVALLACNGDGKGSGIDDDGDGHEPPADCDDGDDGVHPGADEVPYDGIDQDCSGGDLVDVDEDGFEQGPDCDDADPGVHPDAEEVPYDGVDQDCVDGDLMDVDEDGYEPPEDCVDDDPTVHPNALDGVGNGIDDDCDGVDGIDGDGDTFASGASGGPDCDDTDPLRNPDAADTWYDGVDSDCDGRCDYDQDGDGAILAGSPVVNGSSCDALAGPGTFADEDCDESDPAASTAAVLSTSPEDGAQTVVVTDLVQVTLSTPEPAASLALSDASGTPVPGTSSVAGAVVTFTPAAPLLAGVEYTVAASFSCGPWTSSFTTIGPVDAGTLVGRVWEADLASGTFVEPPGIGALVGVFVSSTVLLSVTDESAGTIDLRGALTIGGAQDLCSPTVELPATSFAANPRFEVGPTDLPVEGAGVSLVLGQTTVSGLFSVDGSDMLEVALSGELDTRPLVDPVIGGGPPDAVCDLFAVFGVSCLACADGTGDYCLWIEIEDVPTPEVPGGVLVERTDADIAADPGCP